MNESNVLIVTQEQRFGLDSVGAGYLSPGEVCIANIQAYIDPLKSQVSIRPAFQWLPCARRSVFNRSKSQIYAQL